MLNAQVTEELQEKDTVPEYQKLYKKAVTFIDSGKYKESLPVLKKVLKENKEFYMAHTKMAYAHMKLKDYKEAEKAIQKSEAIMPLDFETQKIKGINFYLNNKYRESKSAIDTAIGIARDDKIDDAELFYYRAQLMFKGKSYKSALEACESAVEIKPKYIEAILLKAEIRFASKEWNYAIKELNDAIKLMPADKPDYSAYKLRAKCKFEVKDFKGAVTDWNVYIDGVPGEEEALISRGAAKININDNSGAIADLDEAIKINKKNPVSYCYRGVAKGGNKSFTEGLKDLDEAIKLKFDYGAAYVNRAAIKMALKQKEEACKDLQKADSLGDNMAYKLIEQYCKGVK
jgi:tetratricopeptide (TPR) repeat protein